MYSPPVNTVPKPGTDTLHLMVDHSSGKFGLNMMIAPEDISGIHMDGIRTLGASILQHHAHHHGMRLIIFKSDVSAAYQQLPIHPFFQIIQIITVNGQQYVDRNNNFSGRASQILWQLFMLVVMWILVFQQGLWALKCYVDDVFSIVRAGDLCWYPPYAKAMPTAQVCVLELWDKIQLPHVEKQQISGAVIPVLGFEVDPNWMSAYLSFEKHELLVECAGNLLHRMSKPL